MHVKVRQERFHSVVMDEPHLLAAARYVELNPVRAGLCGVPGTGSSGDSILNLNVALSFRMNAVARIARVLAPGPSYHVTQPGNRHRQTFLVDQDYAVYRHLMAVSCERCGTHVPADRWARRISSSASTRAWAGGCGRRSLVRRPRSKILVRPIGFPAWARSKLRILSRPYRLHLATAICKVGM